MKGAEEFVEYGDKLIKFGRLIKNPKAKLQDLIGAGLECGMIVSLGLTPDPRRSLDMECEEGKPNPAYKAYLEPHIAAEVAKKAELAGMEPAEMAGLLINIALGEIRKRTEEVENYEEGTNGTDARAVGCGAGPSGTGEQAGGGTQEDL